MSNKQKKDIDDRQMSIYDYEEKYVRRQNSRGARLLLFVLATLIGLFIIWCLLSITMQIWQLNVYAGYAAAGVSAVIFIFVFIVPVVKILRSEYFMTNVNSRHAAEAKRHNKRVRRSIAEKIVDFNAKVDGAGWYDDKIVGDIEVALKTRDDFALKGSLTALYNGKLKRTAKDMILKSALKSAAYSALSQSSKIDAALVIVVNLQLVKDIVFLYGFRPSDARLVKIFGAVVQNALIAYGLGSVKIGNGIVKTMGDAAKGIPFLGTAISALVDSSIQGLANGTMTAVIGFQTIKYLNKEYNLQNILDGIEVAETERELQETCEELEKELRRPSSRAKQGA